MPHLDVNELQPSEGISRKRKLVEKNRDATVKEKRRRALSQADYRPLPELHGQGKMAESSVPISALSVHKKRKRQDDTGASDADLDVPRGKFAKHLRGDNITRLKALDILRRLRLLSKKRKATKQIGPSRKYMREWVEHSKKKRSPNNLLQDMVAKRLRKFTRTAAETAGKKAFRAARAKEAVAKIRSLRATRERDYKKTQQPLAKILLKARKQAYSKKKKPTKRLTNLQSHLSRQARLRELAHGWNVE
jgi:hypothetical protein